MSLTFDKWSCQLPLLLYLELPIADTLILDHWHSDDINQSKVTNLSYNSWTMHVSVIWWRSHSLIWRSLSSCEVTPWQQVNLSCRRLPSEPTCPQNILIMICGKIDEVALKQMTRHIVNLHNKLKSNSKKKMKKKTWISNFKFKCQSLNS